MDALRELIGENPSIYLAIGGLIIGFIFGYIVYRTNFCTMGSLSDIMNLGDYNRFRAWLLAAISAMVFAQLLHYFSVVDLNKSMYLAPNFNWLGNLVGGLLFGYGMVFAGGCASKNLARAGGGDLRSLLVLVVMGLFGFMTIGGIIGPLRNAMAQATSISLTDEIGVETQGLGTILAKYSSFSPSDATMMVTAAIAIVVGLFIFMSRNYRANPIHIVSGLGIGLCVAAGWALTGLAFDELAEKPVSPISLTYVRPTGDAIDWLQRFTADMIPGFGVATVFGALLGAFAASLLMGRFKLTTFADLGDTRRNLFGAALMGIGGVMALGCTVGQAITGVSTLAIGSFIAFFGIVSETRFTDFAHICPSNRRRHRLAAALYC